MLFTLATALPLVDAWIVMSRVGVVLVRHAVILLVLLITSVSLWRLRRRTGDH